MTSLRPGCSCWAACFPFLLDDDGEEDGVGELATALERRKDSARMLARWN